LSAKLVSILREEGVAWSPQLNLTTVNLSFLDRSNYFSFKQFVSYPYEAEWTPFQTHNFSKKLVEASIESGTSGSVAKNSDH
jgi:hypothetical protein